MTDTDPKDDFTRTMEGLERGLVVRTIMSTPLECIGLEDDPIAFFEKHADVGFDCAPVKGDGKLLGMVYSKDATKPCAVASVMRPLHEVPLVSADTPIAELIRSMTGEDKHFWLVLDGIEINGIVTRSDLSRLPVRLLAAARVIHLEQLLARLIRLQVEGDSWMGVLSDERRAKIESINCDLRAKNENTDALESTNFSDKLEILSKSLGRAIEAKALGGIVELRNQLLHGRDAADDSQSVAKFLDRMQRIDRHIALFTETLAARIDPAA
jgi:CBS domain-containing protein